FRKARSSATTEKPAERAVSAATSASRVSRGLSHNKRCKSTPAWAALRGSKLSPRSTKAAASPARVAAARAASKREKLPPETGPANSTRLPRAKPPSGGWSMGARAVTKGGLLRASRRERRSWPPVTTLKPAEADHFSEDSIVRFRRDRDGFEGGVLG